MPTLREIPAHAAVHWTTGDLKPNASEKRAAPAKCQLPVSGQFMNIKARTLDIANGSAVVGRSGINSNSVFTQQAFRWTQAGGMVDLGFLPGDNYSVAKAISSNGRAVVGFSGANEFSGEAFRWTQVGGMVGLGFLPGGINSFAFGTNRNGSVVVGYSQDSSFNPTAFVWTAATGMQSIADLLTSAGVNLTGWDLEVATSVSANGSIIAGWVLIQQAIMSLGLQIFFL